MQKMPFTVLLNETEEKKGYGFYEVHGNLGADGGASKNFAPCPLLAPSLPRTSHIFASLSEKSAPNPHWKIPGAIPESKGELISGCK